MSAPLAVALEKKSVEELFSKAIQRHESDVSREKKTILVRKHSMPAKFMRRFSDSSLNNAHNAPVADSEQQNQNSVRHVPKLRRQSLVSNNFEISETSKLKKRRPSSVDGSAASDMEGSEAEESDSGSIYRNQDSEELYDIAMNRIGRRELSHQVEVVPLKLAHLSSKGPPTAKIRSIREMVTEIDTRAKNHAGPPGYVVKLDELAPELLSWKKIAKSDPLKMMEKTGGKLFVSASVRRRSMSAKNIDDSEAHDENTERDALSTERAEKAFRRHSITGTVAGINGIDSSLNSLLELPPPLTNSRRASLREKTERVERGEKAPRRLSQPYGTHLLPQLSQSPITTPPSGGFTDCISSISASPPHKHKQSDLPPVPISPISPTVMTPVIAPMHFGNNQNRRRVSVDIIGCHQPVELILAKADERCRRQSQVLATRDHVIALEEAAQVVKNQERNAIRERKQASLAAWERRQIWLKIIAAVNHHSVLMTRMDLIVTSSRITATRTHASNLIRSWYIDQKELRRQVKYRQLNESFRSFKKIFKKYLIKHRIHVAADRVICFLNSVSKCTTKGFSAVYVRKFTTSVKTIQRCIRSFLLCRSARVQCVLKIWDSLEIQYIKILIENQKKTDEETDNNHFGSEVSVSTKAPSGTDRRNRIQALKWIALKEKFRLFDNKNGNNFQKRMDADARKSYFLPLAVKTEIIQKMIKRTRSIHLVDIENSRRAKEILEGQMTTFSLNDAALLIKGQHLSQGELNNDDKVFTLSDVLNNKIIGLHDSTTLFNHNVKKKKKTVGDRLLFAMIRHLQANDTVYEQITEAHDLREKAVRSKKSNSYHLKL